MPGRSRAVVAVCAVALLVGVPLAPAGGKAKVGQVTDFVATYGGVRVRNVDLQPNSPKPVLRAGDSIRTVGRGWLSFRLDTRRGTATCTTLLQYQPDQLTIAPTRTVLIHFVKGASSCVASASKKSLRFQVGKDATVTTLDPVLESVAGNARSVVKVDRGVALVAGRPGSGKAVVVGRGRQVVVPVGKQPLPPTPIKLTHAERAAFQQLESHLPKVRDTTPPTTTIAAHPSDLTPVGPATFVFRASEAAVEFSCAFDSADFRSCASPQVYAVKGGRHTFSVRATDLAGNVGPAATFSWTVERPPSSPIVFQSDRSGNLDIYSINPDGSGENPLTKSAAQDHDPAWSPDGARIAFASDRAGDNDIYVMNADGTNVRRLTSHAFQNLTPRWSPDGKRIVFESNRAMNNSGAYDIFVMNADGSDVRKLRAGYDPAWSPDGTKIAFEGSAGTNQDIFVMNPDGSDVRRLTTDPAQDVAPAWSPDGTQIAFTSRRAGDLLTEIYVMNATGSNQTRVTLSPGRDGSPAWSPDGRQIAFASERTGVFQIYLMNADGTKVTQLTRSAGPNVGPSW